MPKISPQRQVERKELVEAAALRLFQARGFHGVGLRDIAKEAGISLGNIYNHYAGKQPLFVAILNRLHAEFVVSLGPLLEFVAGCELPRDLEMIGERMSELIVQHREYLTLVYVDTTEFSGVHARAHYQQLAAQFGERLTPTFERLKRVGALPAWVDPGITFSLIYLQFSTYFIIEHLIGARGHLGLDDRGAIAAISRLFSLGLTPRGQEGSNAS